MVQRRVLQCGLCWSKEKCLKPGLKCNNRWSSSTVQRKRVPESWSSNRETTSSSVQVVRRNWQKLLRGRPQRTRLTVWADQISKVAWLLIRNHQITEFGHQTCLKYILPRPPDIHSDSHHQQYGSVLSAPVVKLITYNTQSASSPLCLWNDRTCVEWDIKQTLKRFSSISFYYTTYPLRLMLMQYSIMQQRSLWHATCSYKYSYA